MDEQLKKEVKTLLSQGYNEAQIKEAMTQKGYTISQIEDAILSKDEDVKKGTNWKKILIISLIVLIISLVLITIFYNATKQYKLSESYIQKPSNWVIEQNKSVKVDVEKIPGGVLLYEEGYNQEYNNGVISTAFVIEGYYNNEYFSNYYENNNVFIHIGNDINPNDNVMDILITETFSNNEPYIDIFLDSIWQQKIGTLKIWYGKNYQYYQEFNFSKENEIKKGVYHNRIKDDKTRFIEGSDPLQKVDGLIIGNVDREDWINQTLKDKTVIRFN